ncbi:MULTISPECIES: hypothetical protein [unclassified Microcoleus]
MRAGKGIARRPPVPAVQVRAGHAVSALSLHFLRFYKRVGASGPKE